MVNNWPIQIDIDDNKVYAQVAYLLDGTGIITEISEIRDIFKITKVFPPGDYDSWYNHLLQLAGFELKTYWEMNSISPNKPNDPQWKLKISWLVDNQANFTKHTNLFREFDNLIAKIRHLYHFPPIFDAVIVQAVLFNRIIGFKTAIAKLTQERPYNSVHDTDRPEEMIMSIIVTPFSTKEDILEAFEDCKTYLRTEYELTSKFEPKLDSIDIRKVKDYRKWFWMYEKNKIGYRKLAKITGIPLETIRSGIAAYSGFITSKL